MDGVMRLGIEQVRNSKDQPSEAEGEKPMALLSLFLPVTEYGEMGETEEKGGRRTACGLVCAKSQAAQTHTHPIHARALRWYFLSSTGGRIAQNATLF